MVQGMSNWDAFWEGFLEAQRMGFDKKENWTPLLYFEMVSGVFVGLATAIIGVVVSVTCYIILN